jgi:Vitamin B12 dependent methionine synthase, activation domain
MKQRIEWRPADTLPERREVLLLQGIPAGVDPSRRILSIVESAEAVYLETAEPRALVADISPEAFAGVYRGEGRNAPVTPVEAVVPRADALALFVATVGARVTDRIRTLFAENEPALAAMVDAVASAAADRLTHLAADRRAAALNGAAGRGRLTLGYSPGYCGWHVSGQRALFACLQPEAIGVTLNASCLMDPLKSVSGVLAAGAPDIHRFAPGYEFCADCRTKTCLGRVQRWSIPASAG